MGLAILRAVNAALERIEHGLAIGDDEMADRGGAIARRLLGHPFAVRDPDNLDWARTLKRWHQLRVKVRRVSPSMMDVVEHHAGVLLVEATRALEQEARGLNAASITSGAR